MSIPPQLDKNRLAAGVATVNTADERARAARYTASCADDAQDLAHLLDMLGLTAADAHPQEAAR